MKSKKTKLPGFADKILKRILPEKIINTAIGDYEELYANIREDQGRLKAELWIYAQILRSILPYMFNIICWRSTMLKNYLKIAFRNLKRNKGFSFITISSLSVGITCTMLIVLWVQDELSFDRFHENTEDIYRVITETQAADQIYSTPAVPTPLVTTLRDEYPEVVNVCRYRGGFTGWRIQYGDKIFINDRVGIADPSFFELFSFRLLKGNPENALTERYSIVLTEGMADKYFDNEEPMGKQLLIAGSRTSMTVTGVMENIPQNSHMQFDFIIPIENMDYWWSEDFTDWGRLRFNAFIQLSDDASGEEFSDKISDIVKQHHPETGITRTYLQPLIDAHFSQDFTQDNENFGKSNIMYIYALSILAAILLFIACINYMNLSTARSVYRSKEIGVRKVTGAYRSDIIKQVFTESIISSGIAVLFSLILLYFSLPLFSEISGKQFSFGSLDKLYILFILIGIGTTSCLLSGSYPAFVLSAHKPLAILKKAVNKEDFRDLNLRKILVITQFSFSLIFIIGTFVIYDQLDFIRNKDLGYNKDHIIYFRGPRGDFESRPDVIKNELLQNPNVLSVTYAYPPRSLSWYTTDVSWEGKDPLNDYLMNVQPGDYDFLNTFDIELVEGRYFSKDFPGDESNYLLSETAVRVLGIESPVGKRFTYRGELQSENPEGKIIGVVKDYHLGSLHNELKPILIKYNSPFPYICAKLSPDNISETIGFFENKWKEFGEDRPFSYTFLDETISDFYRNERKIGQVFKYFTVIAVFIAFIGLFGLTIFMTEQRTKEIGVRKVLGASVNEIVMLLSRDFLKLIIIAALIACPIGWILMNRWLQDFAYRVDIGLGIFVFSFMLSLIIMFVTVSYQTIKAALTNPVESLRYE